MSVARPEVHRSQDSPFYVAPHAFRHLYIELDGEPVDLAFVTHAAGAPYGFIVQRFKRPGEPVVVEVTHGDVRIYSHKPRWIK